MSSLRRLVVLYPLEDLAHSRHAGRGRAAPCIWLRVLHAAPVLLISRSCIGAPLHKLKTVPQNRMYIHSSKVSTGGPHGLRLSRAGPRLACRAKVQNLWGFRGYAAAELRWQRRPRAHAARAARSPVSHSEWASPGQAVPNTFRK